MCAYVECMCIHSMYVRMPLYSYICIKLTMYMKYTYMYICIYFSGACTAVTAQLPRFACSRRADVLTLVRIVCTHEHAGIAQRWLLTVARSYTAGYPHIIASFGRYVCRVLKTAINPARQFQLRT